MQTAPDAYSKLAIRISIQAQDLAALADSATDRNVASINWGHVGDLGRIEQLLREAHDLMAACAKA